MKNIVVVDIDGTLANIDHRIPLVRCPKPDYDAFYERVDQDKINEWCSTLMYAMRLFGYRIVIVSGRPERCSSKTYQWLGNNNVHYDELYLVRKDHDYTPDHELKRAWLRAYPDKDKILFVIDDRQRCVDAWRAEGLVCLQCASWEEYKRPKNPNTVPCSCDYCKLREPFRNYSNRRACMHPDSESQCKAAGCDRWEPLKCIRHNSVKCFPCEHKNNLTEPDESSDVETGCGDK